MKQFQFNKAHREGTARVFDNVLTACVLSLGISISEHNGLTLYEDILLFILSIVCILFAYFLRKDIT